MRCWNQGLNSEANMRFQGQWVLSLVCLVAFSPGALAKNGKQIPFHLDQEASAKNYSSKEFSQKVGSLIFAETNQAREKKKLGPLSQEDLLAKVATDHSQDMLKRNYFSHFS